MQSLQAFLILKERRDFLLATLQATAKSLALLVHLYHDRGMIGNCSKGCREESRPNDQACEPRRRQHHGDFTVWCLKEREIGCVVLGKNVEARKENAKNLFTGFSKDKFGPHKINGNTISEYLA